MNSKLQNRLVKLDQDLTELLESLKEYSDDRLNRKPEVDKWSIIQIMHHLMLSEQLSLNYIEKKLSFDPKLKRAGVIAKTRSIVLNMYVSSPLKAKAPEIIGTENLPDFATFWETAKEWKQQRQNLRVFLDSLSPATLNKELYKHPVAGKMSVKGMLSFFQSHFDRHNKQIKHIIY